MPKPDSINNNRNLISQKLTALRNQCGLSQQDLAIRLQLMGYDISKNTITCIETNTRYVSDFELKAFKDFFNVTYEDLLD